MIHEVLKAFRGEGIDLQPGDFVETSHWRNEQALIRQRKIGVPRVPQSEVKDLKPVNKEAKENNLLLDLTSAAEERVETSAPKSTAPAEISKGGVEKSISKRGNLAKKSVPKRIPPRKRKES